MSVSGAQSDIDVEVEDTVDDTTVGKDKDLVLDVCGSTDLDNSSLLNADADNSLLNADADNSLLNAADGSTCDQDSAINENGKGWHSIKSKNITLTRLIRDGILEPADNCLSVKYLGHVMTADLMPDGKIRSTDTGDIFNTPSSWAIQCKKRINPAKTSGCGWSSIRYKGRSLDIYKTKWLSVLPDTSAFATLKAAIPSVKIKEEESEHSFKMEAYVTPSPPVEFKPLDPADALFPCMSKLPLSEYDKHISTQVRCEGVDLSLKTVFHVSTCTTMGMDLLKHWYRNSTSKGKLLQVLQNQ